MKSVLLSVSVVLLWTSSLEAGPVEPLKTGGPEGVGPLTLPNVGYLPLGSAFVFGSAQADLFLAGRGGAKGLYLCRWVKNEAGDVPVFDPPLAVASPFVEKGALWQAPEGAIHAFWIDQKEIVHTEFDRAGLAFVEKARLPLPDLPKTPGSLAVLPNTDGSFDFVFEIANDAPGKDGDAWTAEWRPYDAAGIWTGGFPYKSLYGAKLPGLFRGPWTAVRRVTPSEREVYFGIYQMASVNLGPGHARDLIVGSRLGVMVWYANSAASGLDLQKGRLVAGPDGNTLINTNTGAGVVASPPPDRGLSNLIAGGEGAPSFFRFTGSFAASGRPVFEAQRRILQKQSTLWAGALPVPTVVDWDGDGALDILSGNSEGSVLFLRNAGTNDAPSFLPGVPVEAGGRPIQIQAGYSGSVQGVQEAHWGYSSPNAVDWNGDGLPDIVMSGITGDYTVSLNRGQPGAPALEAARPLYCEGLDLHGMWRVRPAVASMAGRMALLTIDGDDHLHLYWRLDDYNLEDGGKLKLDDGSLISASSGPGGLTGRCKLDLFDWDGDGVKDLIIGTCRSNAIPNPTTGYPKPALGDKPPATVLFLRNTGSDAAPVFAHPVPFAFPDGKLVQPGGAHESGAVGTSLGGNGPNLLAGDEGGRLYLLQGKDLQPASRPAAK